MPIDSKAIGEEVEREVVRNVDALEAFDGDDDHWFDATTTEELARGDVADVPIRFVGIEEPLESGVSVEIKAARDRISDGTSSRRGRFYYRRGQHSKIRSERAVYLQTVYSVDVDVLGEVEDVAVIDLDILEILVIDADVVDDALGAWVDVDRREPSAQLSWSNLPFEDVDRRSVLVEMIRPARKESCDELVEPVLDERYPTIHH